MPWFGMDIGGTLSKLVYFEPTDATDTEETVSNVRLVEDVVVFRIQYVIVRHCVLNTACTT